MAPVEGGATILKWHNPASPPFRLSGFAWFNQDWVFRRLPVAPRLPIPEAVDILANCTAGGQIAFQTDSSQVAVRVELAGPANMNHMPATGQCGVDLYVGLPGSQRFHTVSMIGAGVTHYEVLLFEHPESDIRQFTLNFPLYMGVKSIQIGLIPESGISSPSPWGDTKKIVVYGTSITQGGCASRPGMAYTNILTRALNMEVVNLGFSGNGRGEPELIELMADVPEPRLLVLDYEANSSGKLATTLPVAMGILRRRHPRVPIVIISRIAFAKIASHEEAMQAHIESRDMQVRLVADLKKAGDRCIHFIDGNNFLGPDFDECTVDGIHPTDLGFMRMARKLEPELRTILEMHPNERNY
ncbi:MAG: SGNH/GDSL hydrolase family protein [Kiritimatiellia bacterium]